MKSDKRYINLLKIIAMLFVISMHVISKALPNYSVNTLEYNILIFIDILLRSSVPIFVLISGYLILNKKYTYNQLIHKLFKFYIYYFISNSIYLLLDRIVINSIPFSINLLGSVLLDTLTFNTIYQMWYFKILFITYITIPIFQYIIGKNNKLLDFIILGILILTIQVIPNIITTFYSNYTYLLVFIIYFYLGYFINKYKFKYMNILLFVLFIISYVYTYKNTIRLDHDYVYLNFMFFNTMFISLFIFSISEYFNKLLNNQKVIDVVNYLASNNFYIFLLHGGVIGLLSKLNIINIYYYDNLLLIINNTLLVYTVTLIISIVLNKIKRLILR